MNTLLFIQPFPVDEYLNCLQYFAIRNGASVNSFVQKHFHIFDWCNFGTDS